MVIFVKENIWQNLKALSNTSNNAAQDGMSLTKRWRLTMNGCSTTTSSRITFFAKLSSECANVATFTAHLPNLDLQMLPVLTRKPCPVLGGARSRIETTLTARIDMPPATIPVTTKPVMITDGLRSQ